jgi:hypothetical protein
MKNTTKSENLHDLLDSLGSLTSVQRAEIEKRAGELVKNEDFRKAAEKLENSLEKSRLFDESKYLSELGWLSALSVAIAALAIVGV